jgi:hypothetical protein
MTDAKLKERTPLSWKAVRRGDIYCAPACGRGCTWKEYTRATIEAKAIITAMKTKGWRAEVTENLGWYWCLTNDFCGISLHVHEHYGVPKYWCLMAGGDVTNATSGSYDFHSDKSFRDPNRAVAHQIKIATRFFESHDRARKNMLSILP